MAYTVELSERALLDIDEAAIYISKDSMEAAIDFLDGIDDIIFSLKDFPKRFPLIPEAADLPSECRSVLFFSHRVIYSIDEKSKTVTIVRVYHGSRRPLRQSDLE